MKYSLLNIVSLSSLLMFAALPSYAINVLDKNSADDSQNRAIEIASKALAINYGRLSSYNTENSHIAPENTFRKPTAKYGLFSSITSDKYGGAEIRFGSKAPACFRGKTIKLLPFFSTDDSGDLEVNYGSPTCVTDIGMGGNQNSCSSTPLDNAATEYSGSLTLLGTSLTGCHTIDSDKIGRTPNITPPEVDPGASIKAIIASGSPTGQQAAEQIQAAIAAQSDIDDTENDDSSDDTNPGTSGNTCYGTGGC